MLTVIIYIIFLGSFGFYQTSNNATLIKSTIEKWLQINPKRTKFIAAGSFLLALAASVLYLGITSGFLFWLISLMLILGLVVILSPINIVNYKHLSVFFVCLLLLELIF